MDADERVTPPAYVPPAYIPPKPVPQAPAPAEPPAPAPVAPAPVQRKGFPVFGIPALIMLTLMLVLFGLELFYSFHNVNLLDVSRSKAVGMSNYERLLSNGDFLQSLVTSPWFRFVQLASGALLAAGLCALYYAMKKPRAVLTFACLWLIPACLPYLSTTFLFRRTILTDPSGTLQYMLVSMFQTASLFCFFGGLFAFLNLQKKGRAGGGPYYGMLIAALVFLLGGMTADAVPPSMISYLSNGRTVDYHILRFLSGNNQLGRSSAGSILKILLQVAAAVLPMIVLCILARRKSMKGKTPLAVLWVFLAVPAGIPFLLAGYGIGSGNRVLGSVLISVALVLMGGGFSGLIAYSFLHLMRRVPAFLFGIIALVLTASLSCVTARYMLFARTLGLADSVWPQVFSAAFDGRLVWIIIVLSFALRDYREARPASLVIAIALLTGALLWGEINVAYLYYHRQTYPVSFLIVTLSNNSVSNPALQESVSAQAVATRNSILTWTRVLLAVPPLLMGTGAALLLKRALAAPKLTRG